MLSLSMAGVDRPGCSRRAFLTAGAIGGGLTLASLLAAEASTGINSSRKSVIFVHLDGGPPHLDTIDLKPEAPSEIRGEFSGIATRIPGYRICEHLPKLAALADKLVFVRSLVGMDRQAAKQALGAFLTGGNLAANQIAFLEEIVNHLTEHGCMSPERLYESPYTDFNPMGVEGVFEAKAVDALIAALDEVRNRATA